MEIEYSTDHVPYGRSEATCTSRKRYKVRFHGRHHYQHQQDQHLVRAGSNSRRLARTESGTSGAMRNTHDVTASSRQIAVTDSLSCTSTDFDQGHASPATITSDEGHHALAREESWSGILDADASLGNLPFAGTSETYGEMLSGEPGLGSSAAREISTLSPAEGDLLAIEYMVYPFDSISKSAVDADGTYISPGVLQPSPSAMASPAHNFRMTIDQAPSSPWSVERQGARYMRFCKYLRVLESTLHPVFKTELQQISRKSFDDLHHFGIAPVIHLCQSSYLRQWSLQYY